MATPAFNPRSINGSRMKLAALLAALLLTACGGGSGDQQAAAADDDDRRFALADEKEAPRADSAAESVYSEAGKLVRADPTIAGLGPDLFGDKVNLYNGALEFVQHDLAIPGHQNLPVGVSRKFNASSTHRAKGMFADWDLEIPRMQGIFANRAGWVVQGDPRSGISRRCTNAHFEPPTVPDRFNSGGSFSAAEYWHGNFMYAPGIGAQELLVRHADTPAPDNKYAWPLTTRSQWAVRCGINLRNGSGEGFVAVSPNGTEYQFDWLVRRTYSPLVKSNLQPQPRTAGDDEKSTGPAKVVPPSPARVPDDYQLSRDEIWILPSLATDRFGNTTRYNYDAASPRRLMSIVSGDPSGVSRRIEFTYGSTSFPTLVTRVTAHGKTWEYGYDAAGTHLKTVKRPDLSLWQFALEPLAELPPVNVPSPGGCDALPAADARPRTGSLTHPSGAVGTFTVAGTAHGRSHVDRVCQALSVYTDYALFPAQTNAHSIQTKGIQGPGLTPMSWTFRYGPANACFGACPGLPGTKTVEVTDARNFTTRYTFGNRYQVNDGQLLRTEEGLEGGVTQRITTQQYRAFPAHGDAYPGVIGESPQPRTQGDLTYRHTPEELRQITQQDVSFTWQATAFDVFARPTSVSRSSSLGDARVENTVYFDQRGKWVLNQVESVTVPVGTTITVPESHTYDAATGLRLSSASFGRITASFEYHPDGTLWRRKDPLNRATVFTSYRRGLAQKVSYPDNTSESAEVSNSGQVLSVTNAANMVTTYGYDAMDRLASITPPEEEALNYNATTLAFEQVPSAEYGLPAGHWRQTVITGNARTIRYFDAMWRPVLTRVFDIAQESATAKVTLRRFDPDGRPLFESYPQRTIGNVLAPGVAGTTRTFDALGRITLEARDSEQGVLTTTTQYLTGFERRTTDPNSNSTTSRFQAFDTPSEQALKENRGPAGVTVSIDRDVFGKPRSITRGGTYEGNALSVTRRFTYDQHQRLCKTREPESAATVQDYDTMGFVAWRASGLALPGDSCDQSTALAPLNQRVSFAYDARGRLTTSTYGDNSPSIKRTYTSDGLLETLKKGTGGAFPTSWTYRYNNRRLLEQEALVSPNGTFVIGHSYNANGHAKSLTYPRGPVLDYSPNALGEPMRLSSGGTNLATEISYHPNGAVARYVLGNGVEHTTVQNLRGLPETWSDGDLVGDVYAYDRNGNVSSITDQVLGRHRSMGYDGLDRLKTANGPWGTGSYTYDPVDNLRKSQVGSRNLTHEYDASTNRISGVTGSENFSIFYDGQGNVTFRKGQNYSFDIGNRLRKATSPTQVDYQYDGHGRRVFSTSPQAGNKVFIYGMDGRLLQSSAAVKGFNEGTTLYVNLGSRLLAQYNADTFNLEFVHTDALGTPVVRSQSSGAAAVANSRLVHEPYGNTDPSAPSGVGFTGHFRDREIELVYMQQRYYDPLAGRFLSVDPVSTSAKDGSYFNRYVYAANNPYKFKDPDGRAFETAWDIASLALSVQQFAQNPSFGNAVGLAIDAAAVAIPGIPGGVGVFRAASDAADAAASLPRMQGMGATERAKTLADGGFQQTKVSSSAGMNETWSHADGSQVRVHPYGDVKQGPHKSGNNAHLHKQDPNGNQLNDRGTVTTDKSQQHIGLPNPKDLPQVRGRATGS